jgi:hypothetical protein
MKSRLRDTDLPDSGRVCRVLNRPIGVVARCARQRRQNAMVPRAVGALLVGVYPWLARASCQGSADLHAAMETVGSLLGLIAGPALVSRFVALGNRFHFLVGLAFFVNAAEDFVHGLRLPPGHVVRHHLDGYSDACDGRLRGDPTAARGSLWRADRRLDRAP